jgi:DNA repair exonuclease SbcCD ATPase subunit
MMKTNINKTVTALCVVLATGLNGCAMAPRAPQSAAEAQLDQQSGWFSRTEVQGALLGAAIAGGLCAALGGNTTQCLGSAAGGAVIGYGAGEYMNYLRSNYRSQEDMLGKAILDIRQDNQRIAGYVDAEKQVIREKLAQLNRLKQKYQQKAISLAEYQKEMQVLRQTEQKLAKKAQDLKTVQQKWEGTYRQLNDPRLGQQVALLQRQVDTVDQDLNVLKKRLDENDITSTG